MTRRRCITCKGEKRVTGTPNAVTEHGAQFVREGGKLAIAAMLVEASDSIILCPGCKGSGFQVKTADGWVPYPQEHIRLE